MNESPTRQPETRLPAALLHVLLVLAVAQAVRAGATWLLYKRMNPGSDNLAWAGIESLAFLASGLVLFLWLRPKAADLALSLRELAKREKVIYVTGAVLVLALVLTSGLLAIDMLFFNLYAAVITPIYEELIFRGYAWGRLQPALEQRFPGRQGNSWSYAVVTILFGLWHLAYVDVIGLRTMPHAPFNQAVWLVMFFKVLVGLAVGVVAGYARWRTGRVYGAFLLHALWNIFGR